MYQPRYEENQTVQFKLPWDKNTARSFAMAVVIVLSIIMFSSIFEIDKPYVRELQVNTIPLTILNFGEGDGTGMSKGNLSREGQLHKGQQTSSILQDASVAANTKLTKDASVPNENAIPRAVDQISSNDKNNANNTGNAKSNLGSPDGSIDGTGLGTRGNGPGKGMGFGDIEWGGGGNRIVLQKIVPKFPSGVNTNAEIRLRFTVMPDGTVGRIIPLQKADPRLEKAALDALRQWRFNPLKTDLVMEGIIPLSFVLQ